MIIFVFALAITVLYLICDVIDSKKKEKTRDEYRKATSEPSYIHPCPDKKDLPSSYWEIEV